MHQTRTSTTICDRCLHKTPQREPQTPCKPRARARRGRRHRIRSSKRLGFPRARRRGRPRGERANEPDGSARRGERPAPWLMRRWGAALGLRPPPLLSDLRESERDRERERERWGMGGEEKWGRRRSSALCLLLRCSPPSVPPRPSGPLHGSQITSRSRSPPPRVRWTSLGPISPLGARWARLGPVQPASVLPPRPVAWLLQKSPSPHRLLLPPRL